MPSWAYDVPPTWNSGIDTMFLSPSSNSNPSWPLTVCAIRLACVNATPLGRPVVPDEYMMMQTSSGSTSDERSTGVAPASSASYSDRIRLACVNATPLGRPVVPDEYMMMQTSSGSTSDERSTGVAPASSASYSSPSPPSGVTS